MDVSLSSWFVIILAAFAANLPFLNERFLSVFTLNKLNKPIRVRLLELAIFYIVVRIIAFQLEAHIGNVFPQRWEFYAITFCLFIVLAFPGFVFRYLYKSHG